MINGIFLWVMRLIFVYALGTYLIAKTYFKHYFNKLLWKN